MDDNRPESIDPERVDPKRAPVYTWVLTGTLEGEDEPTLRVEYSSAFALGHETCAIVVQYCQELDCLQWDIELALQNLENLGEQGHVLDEFPEQKLSAVYYEARNIGLRIYPYQEKTYRFVNSLLGLGAPENEGARYNYDFRKEVLQRLNRPTFTRIENLLKNHFIRDAAIRKLLEARRLFVHQRARRDESVIIRRLMQERTREPDQVNELILAGDVEHLRLEKLSEARVITERLIELRWQLVAAFRDLCAKT
jgi:hypothetical protein